MSINRTPYFTYDSTIPQQWIQKKDAIGQDTSSPGVLATKSIRLQIGNTVTGEASGYGHLYSPFGIYSVPVIYPVGNNSGVAGSITGSEILSWIRNDENLIFAGRDVANQYKAGEVNAGEISVYAPGCPTQNSYYIDVNGNQTATVPNNLNLTVTKTTNIVSPTINLGSASPSDQVARASVTNNNFTIITNASQTALVTLNGLAASYSATPTVPATYQNLMAVIAPLIALLEAFQFQPTNSSVANLSG
jgi:hypothetical protein